MTNPILQRLQGRILFFVPIRITFYCHRNTDFHRIEHRLIFLCFLSFCGQIMFYNSRFRKFASAKK